MATANTTSKPAAASGTFMIGGDVPVYRLGFGAMQITGAGVWGEPADHNESIAVLKRAVELGVTLIDTADAYGPYVSERLIAEALFPYPKDLVIATKGGLTRSGPGSWTENGDPKHLRETCEGSLKRLKLDRIDLYQLHRIDRKVPMEDQIGTLLDLQREGKIRHIGLSEVSVEQIKAVQKLATVTTVQNKYNLADRAAEPVLEYCTEQNIGFIPWFPLATGGLAKPGSALERAAKSKNVEPAQLALAWLLKKSPVMLPIPGTSKVKHLEQNTDSALIEIDDALEAELERATAH